MLREADIKRLPERERRVVRNPGIPRLRKRLTRAEKRHLKRWLNERGHITPNFTWAEARSKDGTDVPRVLKANVRRHAWKLERFRWLVGSPPISPLSWYRSPSHNRAVGGALFSRHMLGDATDFAKGTVDRVGRSRWLSKADHVWRRGGVGVYPAGSVHMDSRGWRSRWSSF